MRPASLLLATAALGLCAAAYAQDARDDGALDGHTELAATVWLKPHDDAAFDAAVAARLARGNPLYHHWMTPADVAAFAATHADMQSVVAALRAAGVAVTGTDAAAQTIGIAGSASVLAAAFHTGLHAYTRGTESFYGPTGEPRLAGSAGALVGGVTGLSSAGMRPFFAAQTDFATGRPVAPHVQAAAVAGSVDLSSYYTDNCFHTDYHYSFTRFRIGVGGVQDKMVGPRYIGTGFGKSDLSCGYTAAAMQKHYDMKSLYDRGLTGYGRTVVIVDAYGSPTIARDANFFSSTMGLPALGFDNFSVIYPAGQPKTSPYKTGWPVEISIDVEWVHAMAPGASIVLVVAPTQHSEDLAAAVRYAVQHRLGDIISNSYGQSEARSDPSVAKLFNMVFREAAAEGIAVFTATGDKGDFGLGSPVGAASIPADSPYGTAVGGTSLSVPSDTGPLDSAWGLTATVLAGLNAVAYPPVQDGFLGGGGGGTSAVFAKPTYQQPLAGSGRQLPDVSMMADPYTGAITFFPYENGSALAFEPYGGTSLASPLMAGLWAVAEQAAGTTLGDAAPIIAGMDATALTDVKPIVASAKLNDNLSGTVRYGSDKPTYYGPAKLLGLQKIEPSGFVGTLSRFIGPQYDVLAFVDLGFGADSSLLAGPGFDNATGYGTPNGPGFVAATAR